MQRQSFIQYDSNRGSAAAANREDTRPWRVVVNPQIERERRRNQVTRRARRLSRALCAVACGILATGLVGQITMSVALGTSTPTSMTTVETRTSISPASKRCMTADFSSGRMPP